MSREELELIGEINQNLRGICWILTIVGGIIIAALFKYLKD